MIRGAILAAVLLLGGACSRAQLPPPGDNAPVALALRRVDVGPVAYATRPPDGDCDLYIDEELRSALIRALRSRGYEARAIGDSVPRSFAVGEPPPGPGELPEIIARQLPASEAFLAVWIDEYWENTLCGWEGPKYLTMGAVAVLYAGTPPREVWRGRARAEERRGYGPGELIWLTTSRLTERLLGALPAASPPAR